MKEADNYPYDPSWVNRFTSWMIASPLPVWISYIILSILLAGFSVFSREFAGVLPSGNWGAYTYYDVLGGPFLTVIFLAFYPYFEQDIRDSINQYLPLTKLSKKELDTKKYEFVNVPALQINLISVIGAISTIPGILDEYGITRLTPNFAFVFIEWAITAMVTFGFIYRLLRLVIQITQFFGDLPGVSLYHQGIIYELPSVAGRAGFIFLIPWYLTLPFTVNEFVLNSPLVLFLTIAISFLPFIAYIIPFSSLNRRLVREKKSELDKVTLKLKSAFDQAEEAFNREKSGGKNRVENEIATLLSRRKFLEELPTWPWSQSTYRLTVTAVLLPIVVWLLQQILERYLIF